MEQRCLQPLCQSNFSKSSANLTTLITESLCTEKLRWEAVMFSMEGIHSYSNELLLNAAHENA
jgi:hypothetical protein